ncbi:MAG TPA: bifunctional pyr operon transcriptional regulator/uracil phosphoribosyltransferase PyrR, partial [Methyloradius sp.]
MNITLPDAELLFKQLADKLKSLIKPDTALVGIHSGGVWLLERLLAELAAEGSPDVMHGSLDVSFYRDDFSQRGLHAEPKPSSIPFEVEGSHIIL